MKTRAFRFWQAICLSGLLGISSLYAQNSEADYVPAPENLQARKEFQDSKFGIFLHWGIYSMFGQGEWYMHNAILIVTNMLRLHQAFTLHASMHTIGLQL